MDRAIGALITIACVVAAILAWDVYRATRPKRLELCRCGEMRAMGQACPVCECER